MRVFKSGLCLVLCGTLSSCEIFEEPQPQRFHFDDKSVHTEWLRAGNSPASWRVTKHMYDQWQNTSTKPWDEVWAEIRNQGSKKLRIVGLVSRTQNNRFIDLQQRGTFNLTLYPGETKNVYPDGMMDGSLGTQVWLWIQDWAEEE